MGKRCARFPRCKRQECALEDQLLSGKGTPSGEVTKFVTSRHSTGIERTSKDHTVCRVNPEGMPMCLVHCVSVGYLHPV